MIPFQEKKKKIALKFMAIKKTEQRMVRNPETRSSWHLLLSIRFQVQEKEIMLPDSES